MPTPLEKAVVIFSMIVMFIVFRKELALELKMLKDDLRKLIKRKTTSKSP